MRKIYLLVLCALLIVCVGVRTGVVCVARGAASPIQYDISAEFVDDSTILARQQVVYTNTSQYTMHELQFNLYANAFRENAIYRPVQASDASRVFVGGENFGGIDIYNLKVNGKHTAHTITGLDQNVMSVPVSLHKGQRVVVEFDFELIVPQMRFRLGRANGSTNLGQWYPQVAVFDDGKFVTYPYYNCGDPFFGQAADYHITLETRAGLVLASSAQFDTRVTNDGKRQVFDMRASGIRDFAMVLNDSYKTIRQTVDGVELVYDYCDDSRFAITLDTIKLAFRTFDRLFGKYPYPTLTVAQTPFVYGGMEYSGLVMVADDLDYDKYTEVVVHELAHQWWYGVVGTDQIKNAWMDEALAEYSTTLFFEFNPQFGRTRQSRIGAALTAFSIFDDSNPNPKKDKVTISTSLDKFGSLGEYVCTVYAKGQVMLDMLREEIGIEAFLQGLNYYYDNNMFCIARPQTLISAFQLFSKRDLTVFFDGWLYGKKVYKI